LVGVEISKDVNGSNRAIDWDGLEVDVFELEISLWLLHATRRPDINNIESILIFLFIKTSTDLTSLL